MLMQRLFVLHCPGCSETIVLPRRSPLGTYGNLQYQPTDMWPLTYLCQSCGLVSELQVEEIHLEDVRALAQSIHSENLWRYDFSCGQGNSYMMIAIHTKGLKGAAQGDVIDNVLGKTSFCADLATAKLQWTSEYSFE